MKLEIINNPTPPAGSVPFEELREIVHAYRLLNAHYREQVRDDLDIYLTAQKNWTARGFTDWEALQAYMHGEIEKDPREPYRNNPPYTGVNSQNRGKP